MTKPLQPPSAATLSPAAANHARQQYELEQLRQLAADYRRKVQGVNILCLVLLLMVGLGGLMALHHLGAI